MIELKGKYNKDCIIYSDEIEDSAISTIQEILDERFSQGVPIRIMPDVHQGKDIVIGFTIPLTDLINPNHVGVDIGCGMLSASFTSINNNFNFNNNIELDLAEIDSKIKLNIPMGFDIHENVRMKKINFDFSEINIINEQFIARYNNKFGTSYKPTTYDEKWLSKKLKDIDMDESKFWKSLGTLGGGNHFIELGKSDNNSNNNDNNTYWLTIHCGSRNFGLKIADYWTNVAKSVLTIAPDVYNRELDIIKNSEPKSDIPKKIQELKDKYKLGVNKAYLSGDNMIGYLTDMIFAQKYAEYNRMTILNIIKHVLNINFNETISTIHNYVDMNDMIIRKGAISSYSGVKMIIPFNQRDGLLICEGKSNSEWNYSAPHGAGRLMSRTEAKSNINLKDVEESMVGIYTTSVCKETIDESIFAYKDSATIEKLIEPTAIILERVKPILNIKDTGKQISYKERKANKKNRERR